MTDAWTQVVRHHVGLGRMLPLGGPEDGAWIAEDAAGAVLRGAAADGLPGVRLGALRIGLADPLRVAEPVVPAPPSALPPGALRVTADFAATSVEPLPATAERLRELLATAAAERLGLVVTEVDLRITELLEPDGRLVEVRPPRPPEARETTDLSGLRAAEAALAVPGVVRLTGPGRAVRIEERTDGAAALAHRHVRVDLATDATHRTVEVARRVRAVVRDALEDRPTVAVLVTSVS
ncbi:nucleopolyhedrovirus P10 family protein [Streptomyces sp. CMSTAAHL-2]|uniref:nucleopolyhedrovirus P10 family protein n=1 Tax=Streptomyces sp. CMSTAAHL-2 TaxID=2904522 RepID=UPI001E4FB009|nr:nucleopolyhedrovirus P10 family protein [Streptomyces sp. CMSTAAHL-2]MCE3033908.1 nucleopolyhedrovirus P10 family protein [Streptomyces sp. CMSTAAHL-2]